MEKELASELLNTVNFENWKYPFMAEITKLCLEYLTLDGLQDALRANSIPDEIMDIIEKELEK